MLIYQYEQNGSLDHILFREDKGETDHLLNWRLRYKICLEIAKGLAYLHKERIIHGDIKPSNILLDADFVPKITDFYIAKAMGRVDISSTLTEAYGYLDPEYMKTGRLTENADVFSYGVVILEIVSGKRAYMMYSRISLRHQDIRQLHKTIDEQGNLLEFVDPRLGSAYSEEEALTLLKLSALCTKMASNLRPSISAVVSVLEEELLHKQREDDYELDDPSSSEKEIDDMETGDDVGTTPPMSEVNTMIPNKENVMQDNIDPLIQSIEPQICSHENESKEPSISPSSALPHAEVVENYSLKLPPLDTSLMRQVKQETPPSLTSSTGDTPQETIKNTNDDKDTLISVIDAIQIPEETDGSGETLSSVPTVEAVAAFDEPKNLVEDSYFLDTQDIRQFEFWEIDDATKNFADRIQGFVNVYSGVLPECHQIAVKRFLTSSEFPLNELEREIHAFSGRGHPNITRILGFCKKSEVEFMLIYEFKQNLKDTTLDHFLRDRGETQLKLDMTKIWKICSGVASGLAYLHENFIHGDVKPANIVLSEDFNPKITNLSPTKSMREDMTYVTTKGIGAFGYLDPEYLHSGEFTEEGDVYSYGVIILELVSGKRFFEVNVCQLHECLNKQGSLLQFVDPQLIDSDDSQEKALLLLKLSVICTRELEPKKKLRPSFSEVVRIFEGDIHNLEPSKEKVVQERPTHEICSHEAFEKLKALVRTNNLEEALREKTKSEIFRLCELLDGSTFLPEARSILAHRVKDFLAFASQLSIVYEEDSSYDDKYGVKYIDYKQDEDSQGPLMDEKMKLLDVKNPVASDSYDIIQLANSLIEESRKAAAKRRLMLAKKCIDKGKEDWKFIQTRFK